MGRFGAGFVAFLVLGAVAAVGCGTTTDSTFGSNGSNGGASSGGASSSGSLGGSSGDPNAKPCEGLECNVVACSGTATTSLSGKVYDPTGTIPLYNAIVYVPNADLEPFTPGVTCDRCGTAPSGKPIATALTDAKGEFKLDNVPADVDFPLVVQLGRWRRKVTVKAVKACEDAPLAAEQTRLPRNKAEGEIPKIAITTGNADSLECFLRQLGLDDAEFTNPTGDGSVHLYQGRRGSNSHGSIIDGDTPNGGALWNDAASLKKYDMVILSCEGAENPASQTTEAKAALKEYLDVGGRVFASHYHYAWFKSGPAPLPDVASWTGSSTSSSVSSMSVDQTFAKGVAFADWLVEAGASTTKGIVPATELRRSVTTVPASGADPDTSLRWLYAQNSGNEDVKFFSFNTPIGQEAENQCGRAVYTDIHVSGQIQTGTFPAACRPKDTPLSPQEKALLFLLMDLASCIQDEKEPPAPPPAVK